jgi:hypothetical protein
MQMFPKHIKFLGDDEKRELVSRLTGAECIYFETAWVSHAEILDIEIGEEKVRVYLRDLKTPGFIEIGKDQFSVMSIYDGDFVYEEDLWRSLNVPWSIFFDPHFVETMKKVARKNRWQKKHNRLTAFFECLVDYNQKRRKVDL